MNIRLTKVDKAQNSTYRPTSWNVTANCELKDMCDISTPELIFTAVSNAHTFNYAYIPDFNRYYFINEWTYDRGTWIASCTIDVLATWKNTIGSSMQYIVRSAVAGDVVDDMIFPTIEDHYSSYDCDNIISDTGTAQSPTAGLYIVKTATTSNVGIQSGVAVYAMLVREFRDFVAELSTTEYMGIVADIDGITDNVAKLLLNPAQYIISAKYLPISKLTLENAGVTFSEPRRIAYGWYELNATASVITSYPRVELSIYNGVAPKNPYRVQTIPDTNTKQFMSYKYAEVKLEYPMLGFIDIPNDYILDCDRIYIRVQLDLMDLTAITLLSALDYDYETETAHIKRDNLPLGVNNWGIDVPINNFIRDVRAEMNSALNWGGGIASTVGSALTGNVVGAINGAINTLNSATDFALNSRVASVQMQGSSGGYASLQFNRKIHVYTKVPSEVVPSRYIGKSTMKTGTVSAYARSNNMSYLTMCYSPIINVINSNEPKYLGSEYEQIISYMSEGFYYD